MRLPVVKLPKPPEEELEVNWQRFRSKLLDTGRMGVPRLIEYLKNETDIIEAPASGKYHMSLWGGLVCHSLNVLDCALDLSRKHKLGISEESITIAALLHDVCKANYYKIKEQLDKEHKDLTDQWRKKEEFAAEEDLPLGHGEKSAYLAGKFIPLSKEEACAIRWHMQAWDAGIHFFYPSGAPFRQALEQFPLVKLIIIADQTAEFLETWTFEEGSVKPLEHAKSLDNL